MSVRLKAVERDSFRLISGYRTDHKVAGWYRPMSGLWSAVVLVMTWFPHDIL